MLILRQYLIKKSYFFQCFCLSALNIAFFNNTVSIQEGKGPLDVCFGVLQHGLRLTGNELVQLDITKSALVQGTGVVVCVRVPVCVCVCVCALVKLLYITMLYLNRRRIRIGNTKFSLIPDERTRMCPSNCCGRPSG